MLRKLQLDIMTVEKLAEEYMQRTRQEGEKLRQAELKLSQERRQKPLLEQSDIAARLAKLREEHWASETVLRRVGLFYLCIIFSVFIKFLCFPLFSLFY